MNNEFEEKDNLDEVEQLEPDNTPNSNNQPDGLEDNNIDPKEIEKAEKKEAVQKASQTAVRGGLDYFTGGEYEKFRNAPVIGKAIQKGEEKAGKKVAKKVNLLDKFSGGKIGEKAKALDDSGGLDLANSALGAFGGGNNKFKNGASNTSNSNLGTNRVQDKINNGQNKLNSLKKNESPKSDSSSESSNKSSSGLGKKLGSGLKNKFGPNKKSGEKETKGKAVIKFLMKHPVLLLYAGIGAIILLILLAMMGGSTTSMVGSNGIRNYCNEGCDGMSVKRTSLSKSDFIAKVQNYYNENGGENLQVFAENAGDIYDIAVSEGVNPELVVVRAIVEGFSPGIEKNNYWGMGCSNGGGVSACITYSSFINGVKGFVQNVSQYNSATEMMSRYAYIGDYWYNPGSWSLGGCAYYSTIKGYMSEQRANEVNNICSNGASCTTAHEDACVKTTEEDQTAYATWQVNKMIEVRKNVFDLEADQCNRVCYSGRYPIDPNDELYSDLELMHGTSLKDILEANGMTVERYEKFLQDSIKSAGLGTRRGVVAAATTLIGSLAEMGYKINYLWGGKYHELGIKENWGAPTNNSYYCDIYKDKFGDNTKCLTNYAWNGLDCSGFAHWAILNGTGKTNSEYSQGDMMWSNSIALDSNNAVCKPGGILQSSGHVVLVIGIDTEQKRYIVAESTGSDVSTNYGGTKISYYSFDKEGYECYNLDDLYGD